MPPLLFGADVQVRNETELRNAVAAATPGTRIVVASGTYAGGLHFTGLKGTAEKPIVIAGADPAAPPLFKGGSNGMQLSSPQFVELRDLAFSDATGNGLNIDDGGSADLKTHHLILKNLRVSNIGPSGNKDGIKLSGVCDFEMRDCVVERWGDQGSAVDMVGCHRGVIENNRFRYAAGSGGSGVQCKGGSSNILIRKNRFENAGNRAVNIGGSTGLQFFRPPLQAGRDHAEASAITVEGNTFVGSPSPIAFVGVDGAVVRFNTIYKPDRWALRILQETNAEGFVPCRNGEFSDNIVVFQSSGWASGGVNIGPNTKPDSFRFARNWWFCLDRPEQSKPKLPVAETDGVYGRDPQLSEAANGDLRLQNNSPAAKAGAEALR